MQYGYLLTNVFSIEDLLQSNDKSLFTTSSYNPQHVQLQLLPHAKNCL